jgi:hypothetical protein
VTNIIGGQLNTAGTTPENGFSGDIWNLFLVNSKLSNSEISSGIDTELHPVLDTCTSQNQYYDTVTTSCVTCNETTDNVNSAIEVDTSSCSTCNSSLCT